MATARVPLFATIPSPVHGAFAFRPAVNGGSRGQKKSPPHQPRSRGFVPTAFSRSNKAEAGEQKPGEPGYENYQPDRLPRHQWRD
jgi:hypothetical protein